MNELIEITKLPEQDFELKQGDDSLNIHVTAKAIEVFKQACKEEYKTHLRIGVKGGGCSGFMYNLECVDVASLDQEEDIVIQNGDFFIVIDMFSKEYLKGTVIDYKSTLNETGFKFENPNSKRTCGCRI